MKWIIDRFEEGFAVVECDGITANIPKSILPDNISEDDVLSVEINTEDTKKRNENAKNLLKDLFE